MPTKHEVQMNITVPREVRQALKASAAVRSITMNALIVELLTKGIQILNRGK
jgi:predicted HicB family RNase H-like nuclease